MDSSLRTPSLPGRSACRADRRPSTAHGAPDGEDEDPLAVCGRGVVDVVAGGAHQHAPKLRDLAVLAPSTDAWGTGDQLDGSGQFLGEQGGLRQVVLTPPALDGADLQFRIGDNDDLHQLRRRSLITSAAGRPLPSWACCQARRRAASRAERSLASRSSPSSSRTRSSTVPSGREVGSSITSRPSLTRARRPLMPEDPTKRDIEDATGGARSNGGDRGRSSALRGCAGDRDALCAWLRLPRPRTGPNALRSALGVEERSGSTTRPADNRRRSTPWGHTSTLLRLRPRSWRRFRIRRLPKWGPDPWSARGHRLLSVLLVVAFRPRPRP